MSGLSLVYWLNVIFVDIVFCVRFIPCCTHISCSFQSIFCERNMLYFVPVSANIYWFGSRCIWYRSNVFDTMYKLYMFTEDSRRVIHRYSNLPATFDHCWTSYLYLYMYIHFNSQNVQNNVCLELNRRRQNTETMFEIKPPWVFCVFILLPWVTWRHYL